MPFGLPRWFFTILILSAENKVSTCFEVFSRVYHKQKNIPDLPESDEFKQIIEEVMKKIILPTDQS